MGFYFPSVNSYFWFWNNNKKEMLNYALSINSNCSNTDRSVHMLLPNTATTTLKLSGGWADKSLWCGVPLLSQHLSVMTFSQTYLFALEPILSFVHLYFNNPESGWFIGQTHSLTSLIYIYRRFVLFLRTILSASLSALQRHLWMDGRSGSVCYFFAFTFSFLFRSCVCVAPHFLSFCYPHFF